MTASRFYKKIRADGGADGVLKAGETPSPSRMAAHSCKARALLALMLVLLFALLLAYRIRWEPLVQLPVAAPPRAPPPLPPSVPPSVLPPRHPPAAPPPAGTTPLPSSPHPTRIRREIRTLSDAERAHFFDALAVMKTTEGEVGRARFGPRYTSYDELVLTHIRGVEDGARDASANASATPSAAPSALASTDNHLGPAFLLYHRRFALRFEASLLAVAPSLTAMPYWDSSLDALSFEASVLWTPSWFGPLAGDPAAGYEVPFHGPLNASWRIALAHARLDGRAYLRGAHSVWVTPRLVRLPGVRTYPGVEASGRGCAASADFGAFHECQAREHRCVHAAIAGRASCVPREVRARRAWPRGAAGGDYLDSAGSVNDPIFFAHHANLDRKLLTWQRLHAALHPGYGYPRTAPRGHATGDLLGPPSDRMRDEDGTALTIADVLAAPVDYTYDTLVPGGAIRRPTSSRTVDCLEGAAVQQCAV